MKNILTAIGLVLTFCSMAQTNLTSYEYWFNADYAGVVQTPITPTSDYTLSTAIPTSGLTQGLHSFHIRFEDDNGKYSAVVSGFFFKAEALISSPANAMVEYEYWYDSDYAGAVVTALPGGVSETINLPLDASALNDGVHSIHVRFKDAAGKWSSTYSKFFFKTVPNATPVANEVVGYEYWYDSDYASASSTTITGTVDFNLVDNLDASTLGNGLHSFHIRFKDAQGRWSSVLSSFFFKMENAVTTSNQLTQYQYWFDSDYAAATTTTFASAQDVTTVEAIDASALNNGLHSFHIRYMDEHGKWSSVKSSFFYHMESMQPTTTLISAYRYWFDSDFANHTHQSIAPAVANLNLTDVIDFTQVPHGEHRIHFQFKDDQNKWSSVITDTIQKIALPIADFNTPNTMICIGDQVVFTNSSVDGDEHSWDFGDMNTSSDSAAVHIYTTPGVYDVTLTVADSVTGVDSTITLVDYITVGDYAPAGLMLNNNDSICPGDQVEISAESGFSYTWNTNETTSSIIVGTAGQYYVTITDLLNPACQTESDTVTIVLNPVPTVDLGADVEQCGGTVELDAFNAGSTYLWSDNSDQQTLNVASTGQYFVEVTNPEGCSASDTVQVTIHPLPNVDLGPDISQLNPPATLDAGAGFTQYEWSTMETTSSIQVDTNGEYWVEVTDQNGCIGSDTIQVTFTASIDEVDPVIFSVYPNPASDKLTLQSSELSSTLTVALVDELGRTVYSGAMHTTITQIDVSDLERGTYHVLVFNEYTPLARIPIVKM